MAQRVKLGSVSRRIWRSSWYSRPFLTLKNHCATRGSRGKSCGGNRRYSPVARASFPSQGNSDGSVKLEISTTRAEGRRRAISSASTPPNETPTSQQACATGTVVARRAA